MLYGNLFLCTRFLCTYIGPYVSDVAHGWWFCCIIQMIFCFCDNLISYLTISPQQGHIINFESIKNHVAEIISQSHDSEKKRKCELMSHNWRLFDSLLFFTSPTEILTSIFMCIKEKHKTVPNYHLLVTQSAFNTHPAWSQAAHTHTHIDINLISHATLT